MSEQMVIPDFRQKKQHKNWFYMDIWVCQFDFDGVGLMFWYILFAFFPFIV